MSGRPLVLLLAFWLALFGLMSRLYVLQVQRHDAYALEAEKRRRRVEFLPARRGRIVDARGRVLAVDQPRYTLQVDLTEVDPSLELVRVLARALGVSRRELIQTIAAARRRGAQEGDYALLARAGTPRARGKLEGLLARQLSVFKDVARASGMAGDEPVLRDVGSGWLAVAMPVLTARDRNLARLASCLDLEPRRIQDQVAARIDEILGMEDVNERLEGWATELVLVEDLGFEGALAVEERLFELPGIEVRKSFTRNNPCGALASHLIGYVGEMSAQSYEQRARQGQIIDVPYWYQRRLERAGGEVPLWPREALSLGLQQELPAGARLHADLMGRTGLERAREAELSGQPGLRVVERDARGHELGVLSAQAEVHGQDLRTTLDAELQGITEAALDEAVLTHGTADAGGAAVVLRIKDGAILTLASSPRYDLNRVNADYDGLLKDPRKPLFHRATSAMPPGSTFKILTSLSFFEPDAGSLSLATSYDCVGRLQEAGGRYFRCDGVHGPTGIERAIERSCNVFFWRGVQARGYDATMDWAAQLGFGRRISLDVPGENGGQIPSELMKERRYQEAVEAARAWEAKVEALAAGDAPAEELEAARRRLARNVDWAQRCGLDRAFTLGNARNAVIGQGDVLASPLQVAQLAAFVASGGELVSPRILAASPVERRRVDVNASVLAAIRRGLRRVVTRGTASKESIGLRSLDVAGKTGTAERRRGEPKYAWFMGYAPASDPEIAFAVVIDRTEGHGGGVAGPVARAICEAWRGMEAQR